MFDRAPKKSVFHRRIASQLTDIESDEFGETTMHDVNIEEMINMKMLMMAPRGCNVTSIQ